MHKFKNYVSDGWLFTQELRFFRNFVRNWERDVEDCDFFDVFANTANTSEDEAKAFIGSRFDHKELDKVTGIRFHRNEDAGERFAFDVCRRNRAEHQAGVRRSRSGQRDPHEEVGEDRILINMI